MWQTHQQLRKTYHACAANFYDLVTAAMETVNCWLMDQIFSYFWKAEHSCSFAAIPNAHWSCGFCKRNSKLFPLCIVNFDISFESFCKFYSSILASFILYRTFLKNHPALNQSALLKKAVINTPLQNTIGVTVLLWIRLLKSLFIAEM